MKKYEVILVKKIKCFNKGEIVRKVVYVIEHETDDKDEVADKAWLLFNADSSNEVEHEYITKVKKV